MTVFIFLVLSNEFVPQKSEIKNSRNIEKSTFCYFEMKITIFPCPATKIYKKHSKRLIRSPLLYPLGYRRKIIASL
jgi:hypothetical protein